MMINSMWSRALWCWTLYPQQSSEDRCYVDLQSFSFLPHLEIIRVSSWCCLYRVSQILDIWADSCSCRSWANWVSQWWSPTRLTRWHTGYLTGRGRLMSVFPRWRRKRFSPVLRGTTSILAFRNGSEDKNMIYDRSLGELCWTSQDPICRLTMSQTNHRGCLVRIVDRPQERFWSPEPGKSWVSAMCV